MLVVVVEFSFEESLAARVEAEFLLMDSLV